MQYVCCILGLGVTFTPNYLSIVVLRILVGMDTVVVINSGLTLMTEFFDSKRRTFAGIGLEFGWLVVYFMPLPIAYYVKDWRMFMLIASLIPLLFTVYHCILPESPAWLASYERFTEAEVVLDRLARYNGVSSSHVHLTRPEEEKKPQPRELQLLSSNGKLQSSLNSLANSKNSINVLGSAQNIKQNGGSTSVLPDKYSEPSDGPWILQPNRNGNYHSNLERNLEQQKPLLTSLHPTGSKHNINGSTTLAIQNGSTVLSETGKTPEKKEGHVPLWSLLSDPKLRIHLLMVNLFWFGNTIVYYGLILNAPAYGDRFLMYLLMGLAEIPAYSMSLYVVNKFGRRPTMSVFFALAGISLSSTIFIPKDSDIGNMAVMCCVVFARFAISGSFAIMVLYLRELFPTDVRSSSVAWSSVGGGIGAVSAPVFAYIGKVEPWLPNIVFGLVSLTAALGVIPLPETNGKPLPANLQELYDIYYHTPKNTNKQLTSQQDL